MCSILRIYRTYADTEAVLATRIKCPICEHEWLEENTNECGKTYKLRCEECDEVFLMYFDADSTTRL